jgi:hypothetical protein
VLLERHWRTLRYALWAFMILCWLVEGFSYRHGIMPDGITYLDIAAACARGQWTSLVNAYWSPGYPFLISLWLSLFRPSPDREVVVLHYLNCLILLGALGCFEYFMRGLLQYLSRTAPPGDSEFQPLPDWAFWAMGYIFFFWTSLECTPPSLSTPDALVVASVLLAAGILLRVGSGDDGLLRFAALGAVLALGYLAKAAMWPMSLAFFAFAISAVKSLRRAIPRLLLAFLIFLLVSGPYLLALSQSKGRFTFGDSGRVSYAVLVAGGTPSSIWRATPPGLGTAIHTPRKIFDMPPVYEYAAPFAGTYPPWHDPSYWFEGLHPRFNLKWQLDALRRCLDAYFDLSTRLSSVLAGFLVLLLWGDSVRSFARNIWRELFLWGPAVFGLAMYALVRVEPRFISGFLILFWAALFSALRIARSESGRTLGRSVSLAIVLLLGFQIAWSVGHSVVRLAVSGDSPDWAVAQKLRAAGIEPGDKIAFVGFALPDHYWAHLAGATVMAEISPEGASNFWAASPAIKAQALQAVATAGVKAIVARGVPPELLAGGWEQVPGTDYYFLLLKTMPAIETDGAFR